MSSKYILLIAGLLIGYYFLNINSLEPLSPEVPAVIVPVPLIPEIKQYIYYNNYNKCKELAYIHNKKIVIIFGAEWCPYCRVLKKDLDQLDVLKKYIVCVIDIDSDANSDLVKKYRIIGLPTSIILDNKENELSRKSGYKKTDYIDWVTNDLMENYMSWINKR
jgi:thiol-disulfide isomerase/thioredoxin